MGTQSRIISLQKSKFKNFRIFKLFRHKLAFFALVYIILLIVLSSLAPWIAPYNFDERHPGAENLIFSAEHWFGTDPLGRDLFSRNLFAARNALFVSVTAVLAGLFIGSFLGALAGYYRGWFDLLLMRIVDVFFSFPQFLLQIVLIAILGRGFFPLFVAITITSWAGYARLVRGQVIQIKEYPFVEAAICLGGSDLRVLFKHIVPSVWGPVLVAAGMGIPMAMMVESGMSLIGLGLRPPMPSWGNLITEGALQVLGFPHMVIFPAISFGITLLAFTYLSDGLAEVFAREK